MLPNILFARSLDLLIILGVGFLTTPVIATKIVNYIKPNNNESECPDNPCFLLNEYTKNLSKYFISNSEIVFLPGIHNLNGHFRLENLTDVMLLGSKSGPDIFFAPLTNITWFNCNNVSITYLSFHLRESRGAREIDFFFSLYFLQSESIKNLGLHSYGFRISVLYSSFMQNECHLRI